VRNICHLLFIKKPKEKTAKTGVLQSQTSEALPAEIRAHPGHRAMASYLRFHWRLGMIGFVRKFFSLPFPWAAPRSRDTLHRLCPLS
jgi:hypothetical protein